MRMLYRFVARLFITAIVLLAVSGKSYSQTTWTDSLNVRIADSTVVRVSGKAYLEFAVVVERMNAQWNNKDTVMGDCDLYFNYIPESFVGNPQLTWVNKNLYTTGGSMDARLQVLTKIWADRLFIDISKRDDKFNNFTKEFKFIRSKVDTICKVRWELKTVTGAQGDAALPARLGITWDPQSTGLQSFGGNPVIEDLQGAIPVPPGANIFLDWEDIPLACEGDPLEIGVYAYTSGEGLKFTWYDSIPGVPGWKEIVQGDAPTGLLSHNHDGHHSFDYELRGKGDTLYIKKVSAQMDSVYFRCQAWDASLAMGKITVPPMRLLVHHNLKGFLSKLGGTLTPNVVDTVSKCLDNEVSIQFNAYGMAKKELESVDSVFFLYYWWPTPATPKWDTVAFSFMSDPYEIGDERINGQDVYCWTHKVKDSGQYYIHKMWTKYCENSYPDPVYDTIYIKEGSFQQLKRLTVLAGMTINTDTLSKLPGGNPGSGNIWNLNPDLGSVKVQAGIARYTAKQIAGVDTIVYKYPTTEPGGCHWIYREIEVQNFKYLSVKVMLEGPYMTGGKMRSLLTSANLNNTNFGFPKNAAGSYFMSPYPEFDKDSIRMNQLRALAAKVENSGAEICDWILIRLREVDPSGKAGDYVASKSVFLKNDGTVCDTTGKNYVKFENLKDNKYYVVIHHRNHLNIMSLNPITFVTDATALSGGISVGGDLTILGNVYDGLSVPFEALKMNRGVGMMYAGDLLKSKPGKRSIITTADITEVNNQIKINGILRGYYLGDIDFNTLVTTSDRTKVTPNAKFGIYEKF